MLGIITTALIIIALSFGVTVAFGQSVAPYSTCIKSTDHGYNIILQENNNCNSKATLRNCCHITKQMVIMKWDVRLSRVYRRFT